jgi:hypothetical protein
MNVVDFERQNQQPLSGTLKINNLYQVRSKSTTFIRYAQNQQHSSGTLKINNIHQVRSKSITFIRYECY